MRAASSSSLCRCALCAGASDGSVWTARRHGILGEFMEYVARSPVIGESSSVFVAYLGVLTALAQGEEGAQVRSYGVCCCCARFKEKGGWTSAPWRACRQCTSSCDRATSMSRCLGAACSM